jgi:hypothetical protein
LGRGQGSCDCEVREGAKGVRSVERRLVRKKCSVDVSIRAGKVVATSYKMKRKLGFFGSSTITIFFLLGLKLSLRLKGRCPVGREIDV